MAAFPGGAMRNRNTERLVHFLLVAFLLSGVASAQNVPAIDVFGGYSYLRFNVPSGSSQLSITSDHLIPRGWEASGSVLLLRHIAAEADFGVQKLNRCGGTAFNCNNFSYMFGPRYELGGRTGRLSGFVHVLAGRDRMNLPLSAPGQSVPDTSIAAAAGAGLNYWFFRHVGLQLGPVDFVYTNHLNDSRFPAQYSYRGAAGIVVRFGGEAQPEPPKPEPKPEKKKSKGHRSWIRPWHKSKPEPEAEPSGTQPTTSSQPAAKPKKKKSKGHRSWIRPWHKSRPEPEPEPEPSETQPSEAKPSAAPGQRPASAGAPASTNATAVSRGMPIHPLGIVVGPHGFEGAQILQIDAGSVAEMAALQVGDLIKSVDGKTIRTPMELAAELVDRTGKVRIGIQRGDFATETSLVLGGR